MASFTTTLLKHTSPTDYYFWEIHVKSTLALITYPETVFTANNMLNT